MRSIDATVRLKVAVAVPRRTRFRWSVAAAVFVLAALRRSALRRGSPARDGLDQARQARGKRPVAVEALTRELEQSRAAVAECAA